MTAHLSDANDRLRALNPHQSFIVQAPAGSGKTALLIQRFLTLLSTVDKPEEILAITFTKKAANEMRARITKALKEAALATAVKNDYEKHTRELAEKILDRDKAYHWQLLNNPNQLRIQTIDSFCTYLTKQLPLLSQFGAPPTLTNQPDKLYSEAVQTLLGHIEADNAWSAALSRLLLHLDNDLNKLHDLLVTLLMKRDQWLPYIHLNESTDAIRHQLESHLAAVVSAHLKQLTYLLQDINIERPNHSPADLPAWRAIAAFLLTKNGDYRKRLNKDLLEQLSQRENLRLALFHLFSLPDPHYVDSQWQLLQDLFSILKVAAAQLRITFSQHEQIDFIENASAALLALGNEDETTDLALALDYQIKHILVDEFQDTSSTQYRLLQKLTEGFQLDDGRTLFVVGDPMQSIYRFREAEVGLFIRMCEQGLGNIPLIPLTLSANFRSTAAIVEWNNHHFSAIFPKEANIGTGAVNYSPSSTHDHQETQQPAVTIQQTSTDQADTIINYLHTTLTNYPDDNIAILVRSRSHLTDIIPALKKANIAYHAVDIDPLATRQSIQDLLSLTCAYLHPYDDVAWSAILRAPWCGLTLADMLLLTQHKKTAAIFSQISKAEVVAKLSEDGQRRINILFPLMQNSLHYRGRDSLSSSIKQLWLALGGPACLDSENEIEDAESFFVLLQSMQQIQPIISIERLKETVNRLYATHTNESAAVQIMTIYAAKGLEFDTVILPHLEKQPPYEDKDLLAWIEEPLANGKTALLLAPIHAATEKHEALYAYIKNKQKIKSQYETDRLFYVAATRAKKRLLMTYQMETNTASGSFLEKIHTLLPQSTSEHIKSETPEITPTKTIKPIKRLTSDWRNPIKPTTIATQTPFYNRKGFMLPDDTAALIGTLYHRVMQLFSEKGTDGWQNQSQQAQINYLSYHLKQAGHITKIDTIANTIQQLIANTLQDPRGQWLLKPHSQAKSEWALTYKDEEKTTSLIIDRTFIDGNHIRWIIDYKTSPKAAPEKYKEKMQIYASALATLADHPIRLGLYFPAGPTWYEWDFFA